MFVCVFFFDFKAWHVHEFEAKCDRQKSGFSARSASGCVVHALDSLSYQIPTCGDEIGRGDGSVYMFFCLESISY